MSRKRAEKIETAATSFARWRLMLGLTQDEAAAKLQKSRRAIQAYERPDPKTGQPVVPDYTVRVVMDLMAKGVTIPQPWPE
jgi:DNA-binding XRE family transcriptional regulator